MKKLRPLILFGIGGLIYVLIELIARGRSHWSMFIVGRLLASTVTEKDDNLIDLNAYSESANTYVQDIAIDSAKTYYAYDINYIVCYSKWGSNLGLATIASDGTVTTKPDTITIRVNISKNKNPYFGLTRR